MNNPLLKTPMIFEHPAQVDLLDVHSTRVVSWDRSDFSVKSVPPGFGFILSGTATLSGSKDSFALDGGMFYSVPQGWSVKGGCGFHVSSGFCPPYLQIGGPIEQTGRLRYIDGCTDSLLIHPISFGDPCLNALYFPPRVDQTVHTHPSSRVGLVVRGSGWCKAEGGARLPLQVGNLFVLPPNAVHGFISNDEGMTVIAYHPDSDTGPTDVNHPMINRTIVDGVSASKLLAIQTKR
jgi:hypothetical protein